MDGKIPLTDVSQVKQCSRCRIAHS